METDTKILFYSDKSGKYRFMSNFYPSKFIENNIEYNCSEQYFMKKKQEMFDPTNIFLANNILNNTNPKEIKKFGRQVKNYNDDVWNNSRYEIMKNGLRLKFLQNPDLRQSLLATRNKNLYEASPYDNIWGTGYIANETLEKINNNKQNELGQNLLGRALEEIRNELRQ
jgi:ribA/ribD-fused uncharacterized protein